MSSIPTWHFRLQALEHLIDSEHRPLDPAERMRLADALRTLARASAIVEGTEDAMGVRLADALERDDGPALARELSSMAGHKAS